MNTVFYAKDLSKNMSYVLEEADSIINFVKKTKRGRLTIKTTYWRCSIEETFTTFFLRKIAESLYDFLLLVKGKQEEKLVEMFERGR